MLRCARDCGISDVTNFEQDCLPSLSKSESQTLSIGRTRKLSEKAFPGSGDIAANLDPLSSSLETTQFAGEPTLPNILAKNVRSSSLVQIQHLNRPEDR